HASALACVGGACVDSQLGSYPGESRRAFDVGNDGYRQSGGG
ncbi:putative phosphoketolase, partial [Mycobacterium marinum]